MKFRRLVLDRRFTIPLTSAALVFLALRTFGTAQSSRRSASPTQGVVRALNEGRYDEVDSLVEKLDGRDPAAAALKARAAIARGRYADAEAALRPVAARAPTSEAALELGLLQQMLGHADAAAPVLEKVAALAETSNDANELARGARALRGLGRYREANAAYRDAAAASPNDAAINTAWGDLFREKFQSGEALKSYQIALQSDATWVAALMGSARTLADENPPQAVALAKRALDINGSSVDAYVFLAEQAADADHNDEARESLKKALAVNPNSLDAHALVAALAYLEDKQADFEAEVEKTLAIAPNYGDVYGIAGERAAHAYRFDEAVVLTRRALALDPKNPRTLANLGIQLLRTGDEETARQVLEASWKIDDYDAVTKNLLDMLDKVDTFVTIRDGDLIVRMAKDEAPVLQEYAVPLAHEALRTLSAKYEFSPRGPILIEIFPRHDDFAVRTLGLPGMIGALGACFGRVVTMDSPKARPGEFQWEATLWHELTHVITLQMSNQRLPRWLSEGISTYEEKKARPEWARQMDVEFAGMLDRNETIALTDLNAAFQNPKLISIAYYEASLLVDHIVQTYGDAGLRRLVRSFSQGFDSETAFKTTLNTDFAGMQDGFDKTLDKMFASLKGVVNPPKDVDLSRMPLEDLRKLASDNPRSYPVQLFLGHKLRQSGQVDEAVQAFERAAALLPIAQGKDSPHWQLAEIALEKNDRMRATTELQALVAVDFDNIEAARKLAGLLRQTGVEDPAKLRPVYERITAVDPFDAEAHATLGRLAMQRNEPDVAAREFRTVIALAPVDRAAAYTDLAESYWKSGKKAEAKRQTLAALEIAPSYERAQELLLKLVDQRQ